MISDEMKAEFIEYLKNQYQIEDSEQAEMCTDIIDQFLLYLSSGYGKDTSDQKKLIYLTFLFKTIFNIDLSNIFSRVNLKQIADINDPVLMFFEKPKSEAEMSSILEEIAINLSRLF